MGPYVYENWRVALGSDSRSSSVAEYPLFTDAHITGEVADGLGPYKLLNAVALPSIHGRDVTASIVVRIEHHLPDEAPSMDTTDDDRYHGGTIADEVAAIVSLAFGIRMKPGGLSRLFEDDPRGRPVGWDPRREPVLLKGFRTVMPHMARTILLEPTEPLTLIPALSPLKAVAVIRAARLYQDALWIAETDANLAWLLLVSAVEVASGHDPLSETFPIEALDRAAPDLAELVRQISSEILRGKIASRTARLFGSTSRFVDFLLRFLPPPLATRPVEWAQHPWDIEALRKTLRIIYGHRSRALHGGRPFPAPMCDSPVQLEAGAAYCEKPIGLAAASRGGTWLAKDMPIHLHIFEHIVRGALLRWWRHSEASDTGVQSC